MKETLEMVICPICGKPFPKKRKEMGYNYCVNCSTEEQKVCVTESYGEGDHNYNDIVILDQKEARALLRTESRVDEMVDDEFDDTPEVGDGLSIHTAEEKDSFLNSLEDEFTPGFSDVILEQMEKSASFEREEQIEEED